ncbi:MAG: hypothetical protein IM628_12710 [Phenylobacterium sp.]|uniref:hypothetical protein n=1 Tax=Phenylobacterium sp. TaxID=1871053 RepID=UPI0025E9BAC9|nr:hypothetical protein [Phenylobacterium sp.]MCA6305659.1 hypothetical protein [Phenylobacterium sp.]
MLPISRHDRVAVRPDGDDGPTYWVRPATLFERAAFHRDLAARGVKIHARERLSAALREDLTALAPENLDDLLTLVDLVSATAPGALDEAEAARFDLVCDVCRRSGGRFAAVEADHVYWAEMVPLLAAKRFLDGWEGDGLPAFERGRDGVADDLLERLDPLHLVQAGWKAWSLMTVTKATEKNSVSP